MINWHIISFPLLSAILISTVIPLLIMSSIFLLNGDSSIIIEWTFLTFQSSSLYVPILADKISLTFSLIVNFISLSVILFSISYISGDNNLEYFISIVILFVLSINILIFIPNLLFLLVGWDGLGLTSYLLVIYYQNDKSLAAGIITMITNRLGDSLLILGICWVLTSSLWNLNFCSNNIIFITIIIIIVGSITNSAQAPFSAWLPAAIAAPTPVSSLVHSSTLVTAGVYLIIRFNTSLSLFGSFHFFLFYIGVTTCLMASFAAMYENDLNNVIAFSTLSQLGVIFIALGLSLPSLAFFHLVTHALFNALLFICAGTIIHYMNSNQDIRVIGSLWFNIPIVCTSLNVANLALCGIPFIAGFYSNDLIFESSIFCSFPVSTSILIAASLIITSAYSIRMSYLTLWSPFNGSSVTLSNDESVTISISISLLLTGAIIGGSAIFWFSFPFIGLIVIPITFNILIITLIILSGTISYLMITINNTWPWNYFIGSIWFLNFTSSSSIVNITLNAGNAIIKQEITWIELISGNGINSILSNISAKVQESQNINLSSLLSIISIIIIIFIIYS